LKIAVDNEKAEELLKLLLDRAPDCLGSLGLEISVTSKDLVEHVALIAPFTCELVKLALG
jgi:hypothetical protein